MLALTAEIPPSTVGTSIIISGTNDYMEIGERRNNFQHVERVITDSPVTPGLIASRSQLLVRCIRQLQSYVGPPALQNGIYADPVNKSHSRSKNSHFCEIQMTPDNLTKFNIPHQVEITIDAFRKITIVHGNSESR
ncbi:hypothetical protein J6590_004749 [Homalodisca vitripennis]|nr:hypothetical protein J6590_004749 [Homalodisca vitripennis]